MRVLRWGSLVLAMWLGLVQLNLGLAIEPEMVRRPIKCLDTVSLTFDDGPDESLTPAVLQTLEEYGVTVTFFVLGSKIEGHEDIIGQMVEAGHSVQNHTWSHPYLTSLSDEEVIEEIAATSAAITKAGAPPPNYVRPPYGDYDQRIAGLIEDQGMAPVTWTNALDIRDWDGPSVEQIIQRVVDNLQPGGVILLHDIQPNTVAALAMMIETIFEHGYCINPYAGEESWILDA